jgi:hypothetical protein
MLVARRRRALRWRLVVLGVLVVVLVALALLWPKPERGALSVATTSATIKPTGALQGILVGAREGGRACYTVTVRGTTAVLRFEPGWSADERLGLEDTSGGVVAQPGARVMMLGAPGPVGTVAGCSHRGRVWTITTVDVRADL